ncbi:MAG: glutamyl-tRNA reductase [Acidimicrobiales bacterium]
MSVVVVGLEHHQAPLDLLELVAVGENDVAKVLGSLRDRVNLQESVVLSTCLRTEVYAVVDRFHDAVHEVEEVLADKAGVPAATLEPHLQIRFDDDVPAHLFAVASGLESAVPGESEVLGQVRRAWERAQGERVSGPVLAELFRHAIRAGKRVRSETGIARGTTSFSHAAVELAEGRRPGGLAGSTVVVVGAGEVGTGVTQSLVGLSGARRPARVLVANRTPERADDLERSAPPGIEVAAVAFDDVPGVLGDADVLVTAVEASPHLLGVTALAPEGSRARRALLVLDLGMPRNVDPAARDVPGLDLFDMDDISVSVAIAMEGRQGEVEAALAIVAEEVERYRAASRARGAAPVVAALRARLEEYRSAELERRRGQFAGLTEEDWSQVDAVTRAVLAKLVHDPTVLLKESAGTPRGERLVEALRLLFDL